MATAGSYRISRLIRTPKPARIDKQRRILYKSWTGNNSTAKLLVAVCAFTFTVFGFWWNRRTARKALAYEVSSVPFTSVSHDFDGRLKVIFDGAPVGTVSVVTIRIKNDGATPIRREDFEKPLACVLAEPNRFLTAKVSARQPKELDPQLIETVDQTRIEGLNHSF